MRFLLCSALSSLGAGSSPAGGKHESLSVEHEEASPNRERERMASRPTLPPAE